MTHFTESKGGYVGGQSGSIFSGNVVPGHVLPTDTFTTTNTCGFALVWNTCKESFKVSNKQCLGCKRSSGEGSHSDLKLNPLLLV